MDGERPSGDRRIAGRGALTVGSESSGDNGPPDWVSERPSAPRRQLLRAAGGTLAGIAASAGCIGGGGFAGDPDHVTIEYADVAGERSADVFQPAVTELEERHGTTIDLVFTEIPYEEMRRQLLTRVGGGNPPDIAAIDQIWMGEFIDSGELMDLTDLTGEIGFDDYLDAFADPLSEAGATYGIPITTDVRGLYWNREYFADAGLDPDTPPRTWSDFFDVAAAVHDPPERYGAVYFIAGGRWTVSLFANGGRILDEETMAPRFNDPPGREAAQFVHDIYHGEGVGPGNPPYADGAATARNFLDGQYGMTVVEGSWLDYFAGELGYSDEEMRDRFGFAPSPYPEGGEPATMSGGFAWAGFSRTEHPDLVADFLEIVGSEEFKRDLAIETGDIPTRESLLDNQEIWDRILYADTIQELLARTETRPIRHWPVVADALNPALQEIGFGETAPGPALDAAAATVDDEL